VKAFSWVEIKATGEKGVVHKILDNGTLQLLVPRMDSPFPKWVDVNKKEVRRIKTTTSVDTLDEAPF
jgi:hypothetical protein